MQNRRFRFDNVKAERASRFSAALSDALHELKLTHKDVAQELGITRYSVDSWTRATDPTMPGDENLVKLCAMLETYRTGLGVSIAAIADFDWEPPSKAVEKSPVPLRALDAPSPNNLPHPLSSFIGREREMVEVEELIDSSRLFSITGTGGIGKTSLAIKVAWRLLDKKAFPDGIWLVELASLSNPLLVSQAIAQVLGVSAGSARPAIESLADFLRHKQSLIVLDNCEHLIDACAAACGRLLTTCPHLTILTTSREALAITGEVEWRLTSLSYPPRLLEDETRTLEELAAFESVRLFIDRAHAVRPDFALDEENAPFVEEICRRLDGIPLAIELAAACLRFLSPRQITSGLDDRFHLLTDGGRNVLPRHRTLKAIIDWSYNLLSEEERLLYRRLGVFTGGWTLQSAGEICADDRLPNTAIRALMGQLVSKSLITADTGAEEARYRMLETLREYARERLNETDEAEWLKRRLADYCLRLVRTLADELSGPDRALWMNRVDADNDNIRGALRWAINEPKTEVAVELAGKLRLFWNSMGYMGEGSRWLDEVIDMPTFGSADPIARALALNSAGVLAYNLGRSDKAQDYYTKALGIYRETDYKPGIAAALTTLGVSANRHANHEIARRYLEEVVDIRRELGEKRGMAIALHNLSDIYLYSGDYDRAIELDEQVMEMFEEIGEIYLIASGLESLGIAYLRKGYYERSITTLQRGIALYGEVNNRVLAYANTKLGIAALRSENFALAASALADAVTRSFATEDKTSLCEAISGLAVLALREGDPARAGRIMGIAESLLEAAGVQLDPPDIIEYNINREAVAAYITSPIIPDNEPLTLELAISLLTG